MLNPVALNERSAPPSNGAFPLTWFKPEKGTNVGTENIRGAWQLDSLGTELPVAVLPTNIHARMSVQRSCFTVQGKRKDSLAEQTLELLKRYEISESERGAMRNDLRLLGISHSTLWPDLDGLARELGELY